MNGFRAPEKPEKTFTLNTKPQTPTLKPKTLNPEPETLKFSK